MNILFFTLKNKMTRLLLVRKISSLYGFHNNESILDKLTRSFINREYEKVLPNLQYHSDEKDGILVHFHNENYGVKAEGESLFIPYSYLYLKYLNDNKLKYFLFNPNRIPQ